MASPLKIMIGLHYWTTPTEYAAHDDSHRKSGAVREALADFVNGGLLVKRDKPNEYGGTYKPTDALGAWVEALCNVPWPVQVWVIPSKPDPYAGLPRCEECGAVAGILCDSPRCPSAFPRQEQVE